MKGKAMKPAHAVVAAVTFASLILTPSARAVPPTVTPSPGYDARLQEQRAAQSKVAKQIVPTSPLKSQRNLKRRHHRAH
jgi:hypothetical protein